MELIAASHTKRTQRVSQNKNQKYYGKTRFVVERFFAWLKCGFHRTTIRYERNCDNYIGFVYLASILMYWRVLGIRCFSFAISFSFRMSSTDNIDLYKISLKDDSLKYRNLQNLQSLFP